MTAAPKSTRPSGASRLRRGTSLVEVLIAAVMMTVAVLGLLGSSTSISQQMGAGRRQMMAASIAQRRLDSLQSIPCSALSATPSGSGVSNGIRESWTVTGSGATRQVVLQLVLPRLNTPYTYTTLVPCQ
jgi:Tfp pilus assembly protein PilV